MATCVKCKALGINAGKPACMLGYKINENATPGEDCSRPLTYLAFIELRDEQLKERKTAVLAKRGLK